jgi:hypothetical protein
MNANGAVTRTMPTQLTRPIDPECMYDDLDRCGCGHPLQRKEVAWEWDKVWTVPICPYEPCPECGGPAVGREFIQGAWRSVCQKHRRYVPPPEDTVWDYHDGALSCDLWERVPIVRRKLQRNIAWERQLWQSLGVEAAELQREYPVVQASLDYLAAALKALPTQWAACAAPDTAFDPNTWRFVDAEGSPLFAEPSVLHPELAAVLRPRGVDIDAEHPGTIWRWIVQLDEEALQHGVGEVVRSAGGWISLRSIYQAVAAGVPPRLANHYYRWLLRPPRFRRVPDPPPAERRRRGRVAAVRRMVEAHGFQRRGEEKREEMALEYRSRAIL